MKKKLNKLYNYIFIMGIGDWGLGIGDWGFGPIPKNQYPKPNNQNPTKLK